MTSSTSTTASSDAAEWRWLWFEIRPFWPYQLANLCCIVGYSALMLGSPLTLKWLIDDVLPNRRWGGLVAAGVIITACYAARILLNSASVLINGLMVQRTSCRLRTRLLKHLLGLSTTFYARRPVGDLMHRLEQDVNVVGDLGSTLLPSMARVLFQIAMTISAMVFLDWHLAGIIVPLLPLFAYVKRRYRDVLKDSAEKVREASGEQSSLLNEVLTGATQIQLLGAEGRLLRRFARLNLRTINKQMRQRKHELVFSILEMVIISVGTTGVIVYGGARVFNGTLTAGSLVAFFTFIGNVFSPMESAIELYTKIHRLFACARRLIALDQEPATIRDVPDATPLAPRPQTLVCTNVRFAYDADRPALHHLNLEVTAGERIVIVGPSGSGKSSLLKLIPRLYEIDEGRIAIDGRDVRELQLRSLRRSISFVPQDPMLFRGTLLENLRHGCPTATAEEIAHAAWVACFTDVVERLPKQWETELGPMGAGLSGGERQRLAIARAILQNRPVLVLDEATSALDPGTERVLLSRLERWCDGRLVLTASHRLSNAEWADRVVVMHDGTISEDGPPEVLQQTDTAFRRLWQTREHATP